MVVNNESYCVQAQAYTIVRQWNFEAKHFKRVARPDIYKSSVGHTETQDMRVVLLPWAYAPPPHTKQALA